MKQILINIWHTIMKKRKIIGILLGICSIFIIIAWIVNDQHQKRMEMEKNTDISNATHAIMMQDDVCFYRKPKNSRFSQIGRIDKGTNVYILEEYISENKEEWYKVKCNDRVGYVLQKYVSYYQRIDEEKVLMSDVSKFNLQFHHFTGTEDYEVFLLENGIQYVYIRAGGRGYGAEGNFYTDTQFQVFVNACEYLRIPYGFYYIDEATNSEEIDEEVEFIKQFLETYATSMCKLPLAIDIESHDGVGRADNIWKDRVFLAAELVQKFNAIGIRNIIYSNAKTANEYLYQVDTSFWISYYPKIERIPEGWYTDTDQEPAKNMDFMNKVIAWQFTEDGVGEHIKDKVDISLVKNSFFKQFIEE